MELYYAVVLIVEISFVKNCTNAFFSLQEENFQELLEVFWSKILLKYFIFVNVNFNHLKGNFDSSVLHFIRRSPLPPKLT